MTPNGASETLLTIVEVPPLRASLDALAEADPIERAAAATTVGTYGVDAIWIAPTRRGAEIRASLCLAAGAPAADVCRALEMWSP